MKKNRFVSALALLLALLLCAYAAAEEAANVVSAAVDEAAEAVEMELYADVADAALPTNEGEEPPVAEPVTEPVAGPEEEKVAIDESGFPDAFFRQYIATEKDTDHDGALSRQEIEAVTEIAVSGKGIASLKGVEFFMNLETLDCSDNRIAAIDLTGNSLLKRLNCAGNKLKALDMTYQGELASLKCDHNQLKALDLTAQTALEQLVCDHNQIAELKLPAKKNLKLATLRIGGNKLDAVDIKNCGKLRAMVKGKKRTLDSKAALMEWKDSANSLCVDRKTQVLAGSERLYAQVKIDKASFPDKVFRQYVLEEMAGKKKIEDNEWLDLTKLGDVKEIVINAAKCADLTGIAYFSNLQTLDCTGCKLKALDLSANAKLAVLKCGGNALARLDLTQNTALKTLDCSKNALTSLLLPKGKKLTSLNCYGNKKLKKLDLSGSTGLKKLDCSENALTALDLAKNTKLTWVNAYGNKLSKLDTGSCRKLATLYCGSNKLKALDVSGNTELKDLRCEQNRLAALDVQKNTKLAYLDCESNKLKALDLSKNRKMNYLYTAGNRIASLDIQACPKLVDHIRQDRYGDAKTVQWWKGDTCFMEIDASMKITEGEKVLYAK